MKRAIHIWILGFCFLFLAGCSKSIPDKSTISVSKKGVVTCTAVEEFGKSFYDTAELQSEIEEEIAAYNGKFSEEHLTLNSFEVEDGIAKLQIEFDEAKYYADYSGMALFVGSVAEAQASGYDLSGEYMDPEGSLTDLETEGAAGRNVLVLQEAVQVEVPGNILCVSRDGNVEITGKRTAVVQEEASAAVIVYE